MFAKQNRLNSGSYIFSRLAGSRFGWGEFVAQDYQPGQKITVAISPTDVPTTAGFIDYQTSADVESDILSPSTPTGLNVL